ncbi:MAG TPA: hypothetical protein VHB45_12910 [Alloacidobacterium sp.]|nr:hypothetical protein [Alloacidobacterium sp.]
METNFLTSSWEELEKLFGGDNSDTPATKPATSTSISPASAMSTSKLISTAGLFTQIFGGISSAIGSYYAAQTAQYEAKSQALNYGYQADMARINSRSAEYDAQSILESGKSEIANYTMQAGQAKASARTSMAARGIALGSGSEQDVEASMDLVKDINVLNINSNAVRQAASERMQAANDAGQAILYDTSAQNARMTASSISPFGSMFTSLIGSASQISSQWDWRRQLRRLQIAGGQ